MGYKRRAGSYVMTPAEKSQFRKTGAKANTRLKRTKEFYAPYGVTILPGDIAGEWQDTEEQWATEKTPISLKIDQFNTRQEYNDMMREMRYIANGDTITQYSRAVNNATLKGVRTALGGYIPEAIEGKIKTMNLMQVNDFWEAFEKLTAGIGSGYSSEAALNGAFIEIFGEDIQAVILNSEKAATIKELIRLLNRPIDKRIEKFIDSLDRSLYDRFITLLKDIIKSKAKGTLSNDEVMELINMF